MTPISSDLVQRITACRQCSQQFAATATAHAPRPVVWFRPQARLLIAGQAPGMRVHESGRPFDDASGDRLRDWLGLSPAEFYDMNRVAIVPMAFCFPGYDAKGSDLPPPAQCARQWHEEVMRTLDKIQLRILVGAHAHRWHLGTRQPVSQTVAGWRNHGPGVFPLPHPSWRNTAWLRKNPWFEADVLPVLRAAVRRVMDDPNDPA
ncbi:MAG: uracil-DNA glycosylase [Rhodobacterales bacterium 34-62-10]|nr:MAG: uracil-DNA glycosylase [Rhodobacterales bacterium 34-62-10]